ncbi:MAG TPA: cysteine hydrolase family protein, partial [Cyclobacteriaceae bacterium]|nr:cysteine hydrolase family protein [Cyclobacteriaceae bacterium]
IDIQKGFDDLSYWGPRNNPNAEQQASVILQAWRAKGLPIFHVKHNSTNPKSKLIPNQRGNEIQDVVKPLPTEPVISKIVNSAFIGTDLKERLDKQQIKDLVIVGLTTDHCVSTSVRMAGNLGYNVHLVSDATATFDKVLPSGEKLPAEIIHQANLASLHNEFATVLTTKELLSSL